MSSLSWRGPRTIALIVGVLTIGMVAVLATRETASQKAGVSPLLGKIAPDIGGTDLISGKTSKLSDSRGKWTVVNFFATWCPPCVAEHDDLVQFFDTNVTNGDDALFASVFDDDGNDVKKFFAQRGGGWPVVDRPKDAVEFGVTGVPETYIVSPDGVVVASVRSGVNYGQLVEKLEELKSQYAAAQAQGSGS